MISNKLEGPPGATGLKGTKGEQGEKGEKGYKGEPGIRGKNYIDESNHEKLFLVGNIKL